MLRRSRSVSLLLLLFIALAGLGNRGCDRSVLFHFESPQPRQLSLPGEVAWELFVPRYVRDAEARVVGPDGASTPLALAGPVEKDGPFPGDSFAGSVDAAEPGVYEFIATGEVRFLFLFRFPIEISSLLETTALDNPDECEQFNGAECLLPFPSSRFAQKDLSTRTRRRIEIPQAGIAQVNGTPIPAEMVSGLDGFSPTVQVLMHFPGGVDLAASQAPVLLDRGTSPPWIETRSPDDRSLDSDSPTLLIDARSGERIPHWVELDARAEGNPERQLLFLRPMRSLEPGHSYIVAVRGLRDPGGALIEPEPAFAAMRDHRPTTIESLEARRRSMNRIFRKLRRFGVGQRRLQLAFEFNVQSDHQLTHQMLAMREQAFAWLDDRIAANDTTFSVDEVQDFPDCAANQNAHRRLIYGTFQSPLFLAEAPSPGNVAQHTTDENDVPIQNGVMNPPYTVSIPCSIEDESVTEIHTILLGHGIFGRGEGLVEGIPQGFESGLAQFPGTRRWNYIAGATDWTGWSSSDFLWVGGSIVGLGNSQLHNFPAFPDRHRQGQTNTLILSRMMKRGLFNSDPAFQLGGEGVFPGPVSGSEHGYYGISMGGVQGLFHAALSPDIERFGIDVGSMNFSMLLQRSTQFRDFETLLSSIGVTDPMDAVIGQALLHEVWVSADPAGYATHITRDPFPDTTAKKVLMAVAWLDFQVSNQASEITARTLGLPGLDGSLQQGLFDIPDTAPGEAVDSAYVVYDSGAFDIRDSLFDGLYPPLTNQIVAPGRRCDPHGARPAIPAGVEQLLTFLQPGGQIENFCNGLCDAGDPFEIAGGASSPCNPL